MARVKIQLECSVCKNRNYKTTKNKLNQPARLEKKKFCSACKKQTLHQEAK